MGYKINSLKKKKKFKVILSYIMSSRPALATRGLVSKKRTDTVKNCSLSLAVVAHAFDPSMEGRGRWISLSSRSAWFAERERERSKTARATQKNPVSKKNKKRKKIGVHDSLF